MLCLYEVIGDDQVFVIHCPPPEVFSVREECVVCAPSQENVLFWASIISNKAVSTMVRAVGIAFISCICCVVLICSAKRVTHDLNYKWSNRELHSPMAKEIAGHQSKCTSPTNHIKRRQFGMGSEIHTWSQALCNSMQAGKTLMQVNETWEYNDSSLCNATHSQPFSCYFNVHSECPVSSEDKPIDIVNEFDRCPKYIHDLASRKAFRSATTEYLFSNLNPALVDEARKAIVDVFGNEGIPNELITVHVRWGDKAEEMKLVTAAEYFAAIENFAAAFMMADPHIYISTEEPAALEKIQQQLNLHGKTWKLHHYSPLIATSASVGHRNGPNGKNALIALLLAMEAKYYILTTGSNWSRIMNELRTNVVDVACGNCTRMVDLRQAHTYQDWRV